MENIQIVYKQISEIKPYIRNPRQNKKTIEMLVKLIPQVGFNVPLVIDKNGVIVKGHSRFVAGIQLGMTELPCIVSDADEESIKLDRIADNRVSEFSEWVNEPLMHELDMLTMDFSFLEFPMPKVELPQFKEEFAEFDEDLGGDDEKPEDLEERKKRFLEMQEQQRKAGNGVQIATEQGLQKALEKQGAEAVEPPKYYKIVCEDCGHVQFVKAEDVWESEERV